MIYEIDGYFLADKAEFTSFLVTDYSNTPKGYDDDDIFFYGITPVVNETYDDFVVTAVRQESTN